MALCIGIRYQFLRHQVVMRHEVRTKVISEILNRVIYRETYLGLAVQWSTWQQTAMWSRPSRATPRPWRGLCLSDLIRKCLHL